MRPTFSASRTGTRRNSKIRRTRKHGSGAGPSRSARRGPRPTVRDDDEVEEEVEEEDVAVDCENARRIAMEGLVKLEANEGQ